MKIDELDEALDSFDEGQPAIKYLISKIEGYDKLHSVIEAAKALRDLMKKVEAGEVAVVPCEATEEMADKGEHVNSEWLNDMAPIGQARYRDPAKAVYKAAIKAAPDELAKILEKQ